MNKKKLVSLCLVLALLITAAIGGTFAYFFDSDKDVNTMTTGNVKIVQNENARENGKYVDEQKLVPAVYPKGQLVDPEGDYHTDATVKNVLDKFITVTNDGSEAAYIRTIVLIENNDREYAKKLHVLYNVNGIATWQAKGEMDPDGDGINSWYDIFTFTYNEPLAKDATSAPSLKQVWLDPTATNEIAAGLVGDDGKLNIYALSQAVQVDGFDNAAAALNAAFGELTEANVSAWFAAAGSYTPGF